MNKKTLMITGASGFVGSNFIKKYSDDYNIIPVCLIENKPEDLDYEGIDCILHLAALVHQMKGAPEEKYFEINTELTKRLAETAKSNGISHFIFYSTVKVYGYDGDIYNHNFILNKNSECKPNDPYGKSKYEAEEILRGLENNKFKVTYIRPPMIYGAGVKGNMINLIKLVKKFSVLPFNYDENKRNIVSINNLLDLTKQVIDKKEKGIYIPTDGEAVSIKEIVEGIAEGLDKKIVLVKFPKFIYNLLCKVKPSIMVRLYGSLQFNGNNQPVESMKNGLKDTIRGVK
jgi:UDP-glucose 4-epimerase